MTTTPTPTYLPNLNLDRMDVGFATIGTVQPFSARAGIGYQDLLETLRVYIQGDLYNYLYASNPQQTWDANVDLLFTYIENALNETVNEIATGANAALGDAQVKAALQVVNSTTLAFLDARYVKTGDTLTLNRLAGFKADGSADMTAIINAAIAALPLGSYVAIELLPSAFGRTTVRVDGTLVIDISKGVLRAPRGGVQIDATHNTGGPTLKISASQAVPNNAGIGVPAIGSFRMVGPGNVAGSIGILWDQADGGGNVRNVILDSVSIESYEVCEQYGNNAYNIGHRNCTTKGGTKYNIWLPAATTNTGERITYDDCTVQEWTSAAVGIQNDGGEIIFNHGSVDYGHGRFVVNTGTARTEFYGTHFERLITESTDVWFALTGGILKFYGGTITAGGTYAAGTAPVNLFSNTANAGFSDGLILLDGVTFGNSLQVSSKILCTGSGNILLRDTQRQNQFQQAFLLTSAINNLFTDQNVGSQIEDDWFLTGDTAAITSSSRALAAITGTNGNIVPSAGFHRNNADSIKLTKIGAATSIFKGAVAVPIRPRSSIGVQTWIARNATLTGQFTLNIYYARVISDSTGLRIARTYVQSTQVIDTVNDLAAASTWYEFDGAGQIRRVPTWATHLVIEADLTAMGAGSIFIADIFATEF